MLNKAIFWYAIIIIILIYILNNDVIEMFGSKSGKKDMLGRAKMIHAINLHPVFPNIIPMRDQVHTWVVKVPLTPFRAPIITLPALPVGQKLPSFLLYKMEYLTPVRNQGECGACWAFAACDMLSDRAMISTGGVFKENLSVQQLLNCFNRDGCNGGSPEEASFWLADTSTPLTTEKKLKYIQYKGEDVMSTCKKPKGVLRVKPNSIVSIVTYIEEVGYDESILAQNILNMKLELYEGGPFYCAMSVYDDFFSYSGLLPYTVGKGASLVGGHAIEIIGYCDVGEDTRKGFDGMGYWICKNSWGKDWPTKTALDGYFMIKMGSNMCGIESRCGYATPQLFDMEINKEPKQLGELRYESLSDYMRDN